MKSRISGVYTQFVITQNNFEKRLFSSMGLFMDWKLQTVLTWKGFHIFLGVLLKKVWSLTDNLSQCLHRSLLSAAEGQELTKHVVTGLVEKRNDECFDLLWNQVMEKKKLAWGYCRGCYAPEKESSITIRF